MLDKSNFEKWDLLPMSPSKLNGYRNYTCQFIIEKIYKRLGTASPAAYAGNTVEPMLMDYLEGKEVNHKEYISNFKKETLDSKLAEIEKAGKIDPTLFILLMLSKTTTTGDFFEDLNCSTLFRANSCVLNFLMPWLQRYSGC